MANDFDVKVRCNDWANDLFTHIWKFLSLPAIAPSSFYVAWDFEGRGSRGSIVQAQNKCQLVFFHLSRFISFGFYKFGSPKSQNGKQTKESVEAE